MRQAQVLSTGTAVLASLALMAGLLGAGPATAANSGDPQDIANKAEALQTEILDLRVSFTGLARRLHNHEAALASAESSLVDLEAEEAARTVALARQVKVHYRTLAALQRIALRPRAAVAITGAEPLDALRGAFLLKAALPTLEGRAHELRVILEELDRLRASIVDERRAIANAMVALEQRQQEVSVLIGRKKNLLLVTKEEQERAEARAASLARQAADLRELMALASSEAEDDSAGDQVGPLETDNNSALQAGDDRPAPAPGDQQTASLERPDTVRSFPDQPGGILLPVSGDIVHRFGELDSTSGGQDTPLKGIKIRTRPGAEVIAPFDGKVVYSGNFRSYGQILIIDHGGRYHTLLAGLQRIRPVVGQWVLAGEPVAIMASRDSQEPELYLELRQTGQPINPLPWLAAVERKARG